MKLQGRKKAEQNLKRLTEKELQIYTQTNEHTQCVREREKEKEKISNIRDN